MFILSYVTFHSHFCDANLLLHSAVLISEFKFSFHLPGQSHVQNHVSGKENWYENLLQKLKIRGAFAPKKILIQDTLLWSVTEVDGSGSHV